MALSPTQSKLYAQVTTDWREIPRTANGRVLLALKERGMVETRFATDDAKRLVVVEWRRAAGGQ